MRVETYINADIYARAKKGCHPEVSVNARINSLLELALDQEESLVRENGRDESWPDGYDV